MNGLKLDPSEKGAKSPARLVTNMGNLGATVKPLMPSNDPGPMTSPAAQGPVWPGPFKPGVADK